MEHQAVGMAHVVENLPSRHEPKLKHQHHQKKKTTTNLVISRNLFVKRVVRTLTTDD
jgi:hypothetical protein